ncbi:MAG: hypothetical protein ACYDEE_05555 [Ignavibacteriaceae bacterium]
MKSQSTNDEKLLNLIEFGKAIIDECRLKEIELRFLGSVGLYYQCFKRNSNIENVRYIKDLDLIFKNQKDLLNILDIFNKHEFKSDKELIVFSEGKRTVLHHDNDTNFTIDLMCNPFNYAQTIDLENRFEIDGYSLSITDLFLTRMQTLKLKPKDIADIILLLNTFDISKTEENAINLNRLIDVLKRNWGFYHTFMINMMLLNKNNFDAQKSSKLTTEIQQSDKTFLWKLRSIFGELFNYYQIVEKI